MNCFMGYNPLVSKQVKITVWVSEQDGASPVAPSNPSEGDCFIVYATDEAMLSNTPTSKKTYTNGDWADAEGGGGGSGDYPTITSDPQTMILSCDKTFTECYALCENGIVQGNWYCVAELEEDYFVFGTMAISNDTTIDMFFPTDQIHLEYKSNGTIKPT